MRLPMSLAARVGAVAATAAIAVTGATAAASAAAAPASASAAASAVHRVPTTLAISNATPKAHPHQTTAIINGHLTAGAYNLRHLRVWLVRQGRKGHWYVVQMKLTQAHGHVLFRVHVGKRAVNFRLVFRGTRNFAPSVSAVDTIAPATSV
jgi:hypothetical protein